jgi:hypothetical protein
MLARQGQDGLTGVLRLPVHGVQKKRAAGSLEHCKSLSPSYKDERVVLGKKGLHPKNESPYS